MKPAAATTSTPAQAAGAAPTTDAAEAAEPVRRSQALQALFDDLERQPWAYDFFALMRRIDTLRPELPRTGQARRPVQEALRLGQTPEMDFAPAALASFVRPADGPPRLGVRFFGLLGPQGPMPLHMTEYVRERLRQHGDPTLARFLDLFHHRLLTLFYNAWAQTQPTVHFDRPADDRYTAWLSAAAGLPPLGSGALTTPSLAHQAGLLATRARHPEALCKVLRQFFGVGVSLRTHVGQWLAIEGDDRSRLGHARNRVERAAAPGAALGLSANAGSKVWDRQYRFRLHMGPLTLAQYMEFLPGGPAWRQLGDWVKLLASPGLRWDLQLQLQAAEQPAPRLGRHVRLGLTGWLGRAPARTGTSTEPGAAAEERQLLRLRPATNFLLRRPGVLDD